MDNTPTEEKYNAVFGRFCKDLVAKAQAGEVKLKKYDYDCIFACKVRSKDGYVIDSGETELDCLGFQDREELFAGESDDIPGPALAAFFSDAEAELQNIFPELGEEEMKNIASISFTFGDRLSDGDWEFVAASFSYKWADGEFR